MSDELIPVATLEQLKKDGMQAVSCGGREVLLCPVGDAVYAVENRCSHADQALSEGKLKGQRIICPLHGAAFDVRTGEALSRPARTAIDTYKVVIEGEQVFLNMP